MSAAHRTSFHLRTALLPGGWADDVRLECVDGVIASVAPGQSARAEDERLGVVLPGLPNLHSHAFQRGMAGLAEVRGVRVGNRALGAHPVEGGARVEAAGERDTDLLAGRKFLENCRHGLGSLEVYLCPVGRPSLRPLDCLVQA